MSYSQIGSSSAVDARNRSRNISVFSGLCSTCLESCVGLCEVGKSALRGAELIYPHPFGNVTAASEKDYPVHWDHFQILGTAKGAKGIEADSDKATFQNVNLETRLGYDKGILLKLPLTIPGLGSTDIAGKVWEGLAAGAALYGIPMTIGENVVGMDENAQIENGKVSYSPALENRIKSYKKWQLDNYGEIIIQENVEDNRLGVLEYAIRNLGMKSVELKWGQGAKNIGGEVKINDLNKAQMLKDRGYIVLPNPYDDNIIDAFKRKVFSEFERHSRLGMVSEESFASRVEKLRKEGAKYIFLKTGAYGFSDLARALVYSSKYGIDVLTIDAAGGGTGMSPWRMMNEWGIPPIELFSKTFELASEINEKGKHLPDIVFAGGFALEDHIFKGLAFGAPYAKAIGMARAPVTAAMVGRQIQIRIDVSDLKPLEKYGNDRETIFTSSSYLKKLLGKKKFDELPTSALGVYGYYTRIEQGLKQLMAGARKFDISKNDSRPDRNDLVALTREAADISKIDFIMDHDKEEVNEILRGL